ncbi:MAG: LysM peptidoglycan-binding domain-containing protein [Bacteroidales bacterium]|nr:LysM peptidoglycan-binding domain-containing protein [Bacteroidales bacterium]
MKKLLTIILFVAANLCLSAQTNYTFISHHNVVKDAYNFWVSVPDTYEGQKGEIPVLLFLHGASLCGNDLNRVRKYGCLDAISMGRDINAIIIAPQNSGGAWNSFKVLNILNWVTKQYSVDTNRIYLIGMSLGGFGTIEFLANHGEKIAASMELCGGTIRKDLCKLNQVPLWIIHGTADKAVPVSRAQEIQDAMRKCGSTDLLRLDKWAGVNHGALARLFYLKATYDWLFSHSKADNPRQVNKDIKLKSSDMAEAYKDINRGSNVITVKSYSRKQQDTNDMRRTDDGDDEEVSSGKVVEQTDVRATVPTKNQAVEKPARQSQPATKPASLAKYHTVKQGDTLYAIAKKYHTTVDKICKLNKIKETTILQIGRKLRVK